MMFLLSDGNYTMHTMSLKGVHEKLRANGCHSPTHESLFRVFKAIKSCAIVARLSAEDGNAPIKVSLLDVLRVLNGPDARIDLTGVGYEFSGWYTEFLSFKHSGLIDLTNHSLTMSKLFLNRYCDATLTEEELKEKLFEWFHQYKVIDKVRMEIIERVRRFDLVHLLLAGTYVGRED